MNIDVGEYFAVTRGIALHMDQSLGFAWLTGEPVGTQAREQLYDRSWEGMVFRAVEVCGSLIAGEVVIPKRHDPNQVGDVISLNAREVEIWPVTQEYVDAMSRSHMLTGRRA